MQAALLMMLQASATPPLPSDFDLARLPEPRPDLSAALRCPPDRGDEIVVCGRRPKGEDYPIDRKADYAAKPIRAEKDLGGGATGGIYVDSVAMPGGQISKRITVGVKVAF
ncbi:hypothetical protein E2493_10380 [Sphingomonas parva]|uniref:Uncharacterized protein n=1 Tax=Sphingomonas parva TaxID=2555898 RepID=A0A4Y8ZQU9_9SPHN|nr:hypothetical protein [Sphingomonas parva]TFI58381.1 hypothetical protein E2493_10380 [Sphingomonas parva]